MTRFIARLFGTRPAAATAPARRDHPPPPHDRRRLPHYDQPVRDAAGGLRWAVNGRYETRAPERPARLKPAGEWNALHADFRTRRVEVRINGESVQSFAAADGPQLQALWEGESLRYGTLRLAVRSGETAFRRIAFLPKGSAARGGG